LLMSRVWLVLAAAVAAVSPVSGSLPSQQLSSLAPPLVERVLQPDEQPLVSYRAFRRLTASARGGRVSGLGEAWTTLDPAHGFTYQIVKEEGSAVVRRRVLVAALDAEMRAIAQADTKNAALTPINYEFLGISSEPDNLMRVGVKPRRKHVMLV